MPQPDNHIFSVSSLTAAIKGNLEGGFPFVWVRGQVTNVARPASGHLYFSLRDEEASLSAVWFKGSHTGGERFDPLTGEVYEDGPRPSLAATLENGQELVCAGRLTVYAPRGAYQLVVELAEDAGLGRLQAEFDRLRVALAERGYFALERKRPLPPRPARVAVVTSPRGAAVHDFLRLASTRGSGARIRIYPVPVQGDAAPPLIAGAVNTIGREGWAEVLVLIRGGGSLEDLWAFNTEAVAGAVFQSPIPVLAGIGHEIDFTLADLTADVRAATPSHAAQLLWQERAELAEQVARSSAALDSAMTRALERRATALRRHADALRWKSPAQRLVQWQERLEALRFRMRTAGTAALARHEHRLSRYAGGLALAPGRLPQYEARLAALAKTLLFQGENALTERTHALVRLGHLLGRIEFTIAGKTHSLEQLRLRLEGVNPHAPLERGYALVRRADGSFVSTTAQARTGDDLQILVQDGTIPVRVTGEPHA